MKENENIIQFKPAQHQKEQPHKTLKELYGTLDNIPKSETGTLEEFLDFYSSQQKEGVYVVFLHEGKGTHEEMFVYESEIEALKKYKKIGSTDKSIYLCNVEYKKVSTLKIYSRVDKLKKIK